MRLSWLLRHNLRTTQTNYHEKKQFIFRIQRIIELMTCYGKGALSIRRVFRQGL